MTVPRLLELHGVGCVRGDRPLFSGVSVAVQGGQLLRLRGANGSGKTSLLRMICGLSLPSEGSVCWNGRPVHSLREALGRELVYLGHAPALKGDLSALENLQASTGLAGWPCAADAAAVALSQAGLRGREHLPVRALSQGQRKRAALARLVVSDEAPLWVLDEPFDALDDAACGWLERLISAQLARGGVAVLTSHQDCPWHLWPCAGVDLSSARRAPALEVLAA